MHCIVDRYIFTLYVVYLNVQDNNDDV